MLTRNQVKTKESGSSVQLCFGKQESHSLVAGVVSISSSAAAASGGNGGGSVTGSARTGVAGPSDIGDACEPGRPGVRVLLVVPPPESVDTDRVGSASQLGRRGFGAASSASDLFRSMKYRGFSLGEACGAQRAWTQVQRGAASERARGRERGRERGKRES